MKTTITKLFGFISIITLAFHLSVGGVSAQQTESLRPSYTRDVVPILHKYCIACHDSFNLKGGLSMESYESLMRGGDEGEVIVPGVSRESRLVLMVEGELEPKMPLQGDSPTASEIQIIKAWIDAGAKLDGVEAPPTLPPPQAGGEDGAPDIRPKLPVKGQIGSVAYSPDGKLLAAGSYQEVMLIEVATGKMVANLKGHAGTVNAVAFSPGGKILCAGGGSPQQFGEIKIWDVETQTLIETLRAHRDAIYSIAFSPDGKKLAAASYDRLVSLWEVYPQGVHPTADKTGAWPKEPRMLKDHTDAVYSVAFSPDGKLMASASGDRTVKVWDVESGRRLYTLSEATAELYSVAFHPSGAQLAAVGVDKMIRIWNVSGSDGKLALSAFAHDRPIIRVFYSPDGERLFTAGEDSLVKVWRLDAHREGDSAAGSIPSPAELIETQVFENQSDWPLALALSRDGNQLAVGRYDGSLSLYDLKNPQGAPRLLLSPESKTEPKPGEPSVVPSVLRSVSPPGVVRGKTVELTLDGSNISDALAVFFDEPEITGKILPMAEDADKKGGQLKVEATLAPTTRIGIHRLFIQTPLGTTGAVTFAVGDWQEIGEAEPNNSTKGANQIASLPATIVGVINPVGDADYYQFEGEAGQEIVFQVVAAPIRSNLNAVLTLMDADGGILAENNDYNGQLDSLIGYRFKTSGSYVIRIRDFENSGGEAFSYRLNMGTFPYLTHAFPIGVQKGTSTEVTLYGFNLGKSTGVTVKAPEATEWGKTIPISAQTPSGESINQLKLAVGEYPEITEIEPQNDNMSDAQWVDIPVTINGRIYHEASEAKPRISENPQSAINRHPQSKFIDTDVDYYRFRAKGGEKLILEVMARRLGSPLDSVIEVLDANGKPIERATLRPLAETALTLSDRDSASTGFRLLSWTDLAINDFVYCGDELLRIARLPLGPDEDVGFYSLRGQRIGFLNTTPQAHAVNTPVYKIQIHPPGATFSPNGMPIFRIYTRNDDGGPLYGKDSKITFDVPVDGEYIVKITDVRGEGGERYAYRLTIREAAPDFQLTMSPNHPNVSQGSSLPITVTADRLDGFDGEIKVWMEGLPTGFSATSGAILPSETSVTLALSAAPDATTPGWQIPSPIRAVGRAQIGDKEIIRTVEPENGVRLITVLPKPDVRVTTDVGSVTIQLGGTAGVTVKVERQNGFGGRVPIDVRNLPFGVRVLDVGLNGVLVTEQGNSRQFVLYAEPWVKPMTRPFYCVGRVESNPPTENASTPIMLTVGKSESASALPAKQTPEN